MIADAATPEEASLSEVRKISKEIQHLKQEVVSLNKDLRLMEEALLFPSSTKFSVFVSVSSGRFFKLNSIKLKLDGQWVSAHLYSDKQRQALVQGGVQKLYVTNLNAGKHTVTAFFVGEGPNGREYKRGVDFAFEKGDTSGYLELIVTDDGAIQEPVFRIKQW
ncbi:MAG: AraC family transcriptional regulator [Cellvibrionaceae bacterium]|nr:AraC family transcriptional regulator [Cellvibrionaceae bacterium]